MAERLRVSQSQHLRLVLHVVMRALKRNLRSDTVQNRTEAVGLIAVVVAAFKEQFPHLALLIDMDQEVDWFNNIVHLQLHRRVRALKKVATLVSAHADFSVCASGPAEAHDRPRPGPARRENVN